MVFGDADGMVSQMEKPGEVGAVFSGVFQSNGFRLLRQRVSKQVRTAGETGTEPG